MRRLRADTGTAVVPTRCVRACAFAAALSFAFLAAGSGRGALPGTPFLQQGAKLTGGGAAGNPQFGSTVALSANGKTALLGGPEDDGKKGAAWLFARSGSTWDQLGAKLTGSGETGAGRFGNSAALSADGNTALVGGESD